MSVSLDTVLQHPGIWRGDQLAHSGVETLPTGFAELDEQLPGGGWPRGALTEILIEREGIGELRLLLPALVHASQQSGWLAWVAPPHVPYAPALCCRRGQAATVAAGEAALSRRRVVGHGTGVAFRRVQRRARLAGRPR